MEKVAGMRLGKMQQLLWVPDVGTAGAQGLCGRTTADQRQHDVGQDFKDRLLSVLSRGEGRQLCYSSVPEKRKFPLFKEIFPLRLLVIWHWFFEQEFT